MTRALGRRLPRAGLAALLLVAAAGWTAPSARAAEYTMETVATYSVLPDDERVEVDVKVTFENTTPDPSGQFSLFEVVDLAIHPGATDIEAQDAEGDLNVSTAERSGFTLVSVRPRNAVRFEEQATFTLGYVLPDAAASGTRIRSSLVTFPVWSFGTAGEVRVQVPGAYEVSVDGDELSAERTSSGWVLASGAVDDPANWLAQLTAVGSADLISFSRAVPLGSGTVDLQVRAWADDEAWGERTLELVAGALPRLEAWIGLPYPHVGPLVVQEAVSSPDDGLGEAGGEGTQILAGYDQPPFAVVHQAAHLWISEELAADRWIREGFASLAAAHVASAQEIDPPFDPATRSEELSDAAFPLVSWGAGAATPEQDAWAYAGSWAAAAEVTDLVGEQALRHALARVAAGTNPYDPVGDGEAPPAPPSAFANPGDSRTLLDQLEAVSDEDVGAVFERWIFDDASAAELEARAEARAAADALESEAAGWGVPDPVKVDLAAWRFDSALERIQASLAWLSDRDELMAAADEVGLTVPQRLRDRYRTAGGGPDARTELEAESAVVDAYASVHQRADGEPNPLARLGLLGGPDPQETLGEAAALFAAGELRGAAEVVEAARVRLDRATTDGLLRLVATLLVVIAVVGLAFHLSRRPRRSRGSDYTASA